MFKYRVFLVFVVSLLLFTFYIFLYFVSEKERVIKQYFSQEKRDFITTKKELRLIERGIKVIRNELSELKRASHRVVPTRKKRTLPKWITRFTSPHWTEFKPWRGVFVFFISYRSEYLTKCLRSVVVASDDIDKSSVCVFALDRTPITSDLEVNQTLRVIRNVSFCRAVVWQIDRTAEKKETNFDLRLKRHWWTVLESIFNATVDGSWFDGLLLGYKRDILFVEEDAVLSPDFIKVTWYASEVKRRNDDIIQFALGGWSGENMINAHPDTFIVRTARSLRGIAYGINQSTWTYFKTLEADYFLDEQRDWCESMGLVLGKHNNNTGFHIVVPTLSRIWHIGQRGLGLGGDFKWERDVTAKPNWAQASRLLDLKNAQVNLGLRDLLGFLCKKMIEFWFLKETECPYSMARWKGRDRNKIMCVKPPYVRDPCDVYV